MKPLKILIKTLFLTCILNAQNPEVSSEDFSSRQVHLDFHTSEHLKNVGVKFDKAAWQKSRRNAHVNSINIFAKGHHGYFYYPLHLLTSMLLLSYPHYTLQLHLQELLLTQLERQ